MFTNQENVMSIRTQAVPGQATDTVGDIAASVKSGAAEAADAASSVAQSAAQRVQDAADDVASAARRAGRRLADRGDAMVDDALYAARGIQHRADRLLSASEKYIIEQPIQSVLIAAGVGALVASVILLARQR
jgi:ElaB/YqjD/DUF883 family membrane-anchored ribosome-binding protein